MTSSFLTRFLPIVLAIPTLLQAAKVSNKRAALPAAPGEMVSAMVSNGDNDIIFQSPPIDSRESLDAFFEILHKVYGVQRIYWRAGQIEQLIHHSKIRPENFTYHFLADYLLKLYNDPAINPNRIAVEIAHAKKMQIWAWFALYDHGGEARVDAGNGNGPSPVETNLRLEHPEWIPVDRHGIRRMSGGISLAYPEARAALVKLFSEIAIDAQYDGVIFHTYTEQFDSRNEDEFSFNAPVVADYQKQYGVDILTEPFDPEKLAQLRGSYLAEFLRELKAVLAPHNIRISLFLDPKRPDRPAPWLSSQKRDFAPAGNIEIDWEGFVEEGLVDELISYYNGANHPFAEKLYQKTRGTKTEVGVLSSSGHPEEFAWMKEAGVNRLIAGSYPDLEFGYFEPVGLDAINSDDFIARMTLLHQMEAGTTPPDLDIIIDATKDPHSWVRRRAFATILALKPGGPRIMPAIIAGLHDPITGVRSYATSAALQMGDSAQMEAILDAVASRFDPPITSAARSGLQSLPADRSEDLFRALKHKEWTIRYLSALSLGEGTIRPGAFPVLMEALKDPEPHVRWAAARALRRHPGPETRQALINLLDDPDPTVRAMATVRLAEMFGTESRWIGNEQYEAFQLLKDRFADFHDDPTRNDADWGWVPLGEALLAMGPRGHAALEEFVNFAENPTLADHAWQILNVGHNIRTFLPVSFEEVDAAYATHPKVRSVSPPPATDAAEPEFMPYVVQAFDLKGQEFAKDGSLGNSRSSKGFWRGLQGQLRPNPEAKNRSLVRIETGETPMDRKVTATRADIQLRTGQFTVTIGLIPKDFTGGLTIWATNSSKWSSSLRLHIDSSGKLTLTGADGKAIGTGDELELGQPVQFRITADLDREVYSLESKPGESPWQTLAADIPLKPGETYNQLAFFPGKEPGGIFLLENLDWKASNPAFAKSMPQSSRTNANTSAQ